MDWNDFVVDVCNRFREDLGSKVVEDFHNLHQIGTVEDLNLTPRVDDQVKILCDNTTTIQFVKDPKFHLKTKHIKRHYHFVRDTIKTKEIVITYIPTGKMIVDQLTKLIPRDAFKTHM